MTASRTSRPSRLGRSARLAAISVVAGLGVAAALSACGTGQYAQTANQLPGVPGYNVDAGANKTIQLRNIVIEYNNPAGYPVGGSAKLVARIFNGGTTPVSLVAVEAPDTADRVLLVGGAQPTPAPTTPAPSATSPSPTPGGTPGASATAGSTVTPTPTIAGSETFNIAIAPQTYAQLVPGQGQYLLLSGLKKPIVPGQNVEITFRFSDGTVVVAPIPVDQPANPAERATAGPGEGTEQS